MESKKSLAFGISMVWREPKAHGSECYFCSCNVSGFNAKNKHHIHYSNMPSAIRPVCHGPNVPVPAPPAVLKELEESSGEMFSFYCQSAYDSEYECSGDNRPTLFEQEELKDLVRDLDLPKLGALLGSRLKSKNLLHDAVTFSSCKHCEEEYLPFFINESPLVYCVDVKGLIEKLATPYNPLDWRLFIDSSKATLKAVLLHNENLFASIPPAHSTQMKKTYENIEVMVTKLKYDEHGWKVLVDIKVLNILQGQQSRYTKFLCFLCEWDSRDKVNHWIKHDWPWEYREHLGIKTLPNVLL